MLKLCENVKLKTFWEMIEIEYNKALGIKGIEANKIWCEEEDDK